MHIAKALYGLLQIEEFKEQVSFLRKQESIQRDPRVRPEDDRPRRRVEFLGKAYAAGSKAYVEDDKAKQKIYDYNFLIYAAAQRFQEERGIPRSSTDYLHFVKGRTDEVDEVYELWKETRQWSLDYFENIYKRVGSHYDRYYFESECLAGVDYAREAVKKGILQESEGAIIFNGKPYGLDTRVFVNSLGLPTYEAKELALAEKEFSEFGELERLIHVVGPEQSSFFKVTFKAEELLDKKKYGGRQYHLAYGWVKLKHGKMSSRSGNVVLGEWLLDEAKKAVRKIISGTGEHYPEAEVEQIAEKAAIAAVKYSFLKVSTKNEIAFDFAESVNINGDSGPYLQYTYARARSVLRKAETFVIPDLIRNPKMDSRFRGNDRRGWRDKKWNEEEKLVLRLIYKFPEVVESAANNYSPNLLCGFLYDLASAFNTFYNKHSILESGKRKAESVKEGKITEPTTRQRLALTAATAQVLKNGLYLLGIETLERM